MPPRNRGNARKGRCSEPVVECSMSGTSVASTRSSSLLTPIRPAAASPRSFAKSTRASGGQPSHLCRPRRALRFAVTIQEALLQLIFGNVDTSWVRPPSIGRTGTGARFGLLSSARFPPVRPRLDNGEALPVVHGLEEVTPCHGGAPQRATDCFGSRMKQRRTGGEQ